MDMPYVTKEMWSIVTCSRSKPIMTMKKPVPSYDTGGIGMTAVKCFL
jgi:hypothetical protein